MSAKVETTGTRDTTDVAAAGGLTDDCNDPTVGQRSGDVVRCQHWSQKCSALGTEKDTHFHHRCLLPWDTVRCCRSLLITL